MQNYGLIGLGLLFIGCFTSKELEESEFIEAGYTITQKVGWERSVFEGQIIEKKDGTPVVFGSIGFYRGDTLIAGMESDFNGGFQLFDLEKGIYRLEINYVGKQKNVIDSISVLPNQFSQLNIVMKDGNQGEIQVIQCFPNSDLFQQDNFTQGRTFNSTEIRRSAAGRGN